MSAFWGKADIRARHSAKPKTCIGFAIVVDRRRGDMKRRDGSGKVRKRRRAVGRKPRRAPAARASIADLQRQLDQRTRDRDEALEQQAAAAEILSLISNSPTDTLPVFKTMLAKAVELCEASFGAMWLVDGKGYRTAEMHGDLPR